MLFRSELPEAQLRLQHIALELDAMRMELLAVQPAVGVPEDVTRQVDRARDIGDRVERALRPPPVQDKVRTPV